MPLANLSRPECAFIKPGVPSFADLIERLLDDPTVPEVRKRDLVSGLKRVAAALNMPPSDIPCDPSWLRRRLDKITPASLCISAKTWQNACSATTAALAQAGIVKRAIRRTSELNADWRPLWEAVLAKGDRSITPGLCRFIYYLSREGVDPYRVTDDDAQAYHAALEASEVVRNPEVSHRAAINCWNLAANRIPEWPKQRLTVPRRARCFLVPLESFPPGFATSLERTLARMSSIDPLAEVGKVRSLRPATIDHYRRELHRFASELVHADHPIESITDVSVLLVPANAERGLRQLLQRYGNQKTRLGMEIAGLLRNLSRFLDCDEATRSALAQLASKLALKPQKGMTAKNRSRLLILKDPSKQRLLLNLGDRLFEEARAVRAPHTQGLMREDALAISLLLAFPMRIKNLAGLHLDRHVHRPGDGRAYVMIEDEETKTGTPIQFEIPSDILRRIDQHVRARSPQMCPNGTRWLFPKRDGSAPVDPNALSSRVSKRIKDSIGIAMNAHLFRHLGVMLWLDANPGSYEVARRLLGHSAVSHTINMYSGLEGDAAIRKFADVVARKKVGKG